MQSQIILVAEDDETLRYVAKRQLTSLGLACELAEDGNMAVEKAKQTKYALIFMDVQMPNLDGLEAAKAIREHEAATVETPYTPIVAMTANPDKARCLEAGMNDFIFKPVMLNELDKMVRRWLPGQDH